MTKNDILETSLLVDNVYFSIEMLRGREDPRFLFGEDAYFSWINAREITKKNPLLDVNLLYQLSHILNSKDTPIRNVPRVGGDYLKNGPTELTKDQINNIINNKYLRWAPTTKVQNGKQFGYIIYPTTKTFSVDPKSQTNRWFSDEDIQNLLSPESFDIYINNGKTDQALIQTLLEDTFAWYQSQLELRILSPFELAAEVQNRIISIHPFADYNGRISRLIMNMILEQNGQSPTIIAHPENDYLYSKTDWVNEVINGSKHYNDLSNSLNNIDFNSGPTLSEIVIKIADSLFGDDFHTTINNQVFRRKIQDFVYEPTSDGREIYKTSNMVYFSGRSFPSGVTIIRDKGLYYLYLPNDIPFLNDYLQESIELFRRNVLKKTVIKSKIIDGSLFLKISGATEEVNKNNNQRWVEYITNLRKYLMASPGNGFKLIHSRYENMFKAFKYNAYSIGSPSQLLFVSQGQINQFNDSDTLLPTARLKYQTNLSTDVLYRGMQIKDKLDPFALIRYFIRTTQETSSYRAGNSPSGVSDKSVQKVLVQTDSLLFADSDAIPNLYKYYRLLTQEISVAIQYQTSLLYRFRLYANKLFFNSQLFFQMYNHLGVGGNRKDSNYLTSPFVSTTDSLEIAYNYATRFKSSNTSNIILEIFKPITGYKLSFGQTMLAGGINPKSVKGAYLLNSEGKISASVKVNTTKDRVTFIVTEYDPTHQYPIEFGLKDLDTQILHQYEVAYNQNGNLVLNSSQP